MQRRLKEALVFHLNIVYFLHHNYVRIRRNELSHWIVKPAGLA